MTSAVVGRANVQWCGTQCSGLFTWSNVSRTAGLLAVCVRSGDPACSWVCSPTWKSGGSWTLSQLPGCRSWLSSDDLVQEKHRL